MEDYKTWAVGDEVECVNLSRLDYGIVLIEVGKKYLISSISYEKSNFGGGDESILIELKGVFNSIGKPAFDVRRFRKLQKRKTDISQFQAMLNQTLLTNQIELTVKERMPENV